MELQIKEFQLPQAVEFNYEQLRNELTERVEEYKTVVYTADTIRQAKADRSKLNALKKSLNDERIRLEREFMAPFQTCNNQIADLRHIVDERSSAVYAQVKEWEPL